MLKNFTASINMLSHKCRQALELKAAGHSNKEIADIIGVSPQAVYLRLDRACITLNARNVTHAVAIFVQQEILQEINDSQMAESIRAFLMEETGSDTISLDSDVDNLTEILFVLREIREQSYNDD